MSCSDELEILAPLNPLTRFIYIETIVAGTRTPLTAGVVSGFLATSDDPEATAAHASLVAACTHVGGQPTETGGDEEHPDGTWEIKFDPTTHTVARLDPLFDETGNDPHLIIQTPYDRVTEKLRYQRSLRAEVA